MKFGHFDDKQYEYVITDYNTPLPWINYFGQDGFFSLLGFGGSDKTLVEFLVFLDKIF